MILYPAQEVIEQLNKPEVEETNKELKIIK